MDEVKRYMLFSWGVDNAEAAGFTCRRVTSDRQALLAGERSASGGDQPRRSTDGGPQLGGALMRTSSQRLPSGFMERIPEHAATIEAPLTAQDLLPGAAGPTWHKLRCRLCQ